MPLPSNHAAVIEYGVRRAELLEVVNSLGDQRIERCARLWLVARDVVAGCTVDQAAKTGPESFTRADLVQPWPPRLMAAAVRVSDALVLLLRAEAAHDRQAACAPIAGDGLRLPFIINDSE